MGFSWGKSHDNREDALDLPPAEGQSIEARLQEAFDQRRTTDTLFSPWRAYIVGRPLDSLLFTALHQRAVMVVRYSEAMLSALELRQAIQTGFPAGVHGMAFCGAAFPILRCHLILADDPMNPAVIEVPLNITTSDVQAFIRAIQSDETIDLIIAHESMDSHFAFCVQAAGFRAQLIAAVQEVCAAYSPALTRADFIRSSKHMETVFPHNLAGVLPQNVIPFRMEGPALNHNLFYPAPVGLGVYTPEHRASQNPAHYENQSRVETWVRGPDGKLSLQTFYSPFAETELDSQGVLDRVRISEIFPGEVHKRLDLLNHALLQNPDDVELLQKRAELLERGNRIEEAVADYQHLAALRSDAQSAYRAAMLLWKIQRLRPALQWLEKAQQLGYSPIQHEIAQLKREMQ